VFAVPDATNVWKTLLECADRVSCTLGEITRTASIEEKWSSDDDFEWNCQRWDDDDDDAQAAGQDAGVELSRKLGLC
jgi:hypothetical protein